MNAKIGILACAIASAACVAGAFGQDVVGEWKGSTAQGETVIVITRNADGSLAGTMDGATGSNELSDVAFVDGKLSFTNVIEFNGQEFVLEFSGPVDGDTIEGTLVAGDFGEFPLTVKRSAPKIDASGDWEVSYEVQGAARTAVLKITGGGAAELAGVWDSELGSDPLRNVMLDGPELTFDRTLEIGGQSIELSYAATINGDFIMGFIKTGQFGDIVFIGNRRAGGEPAGIAGSWTFNLETPGGTRTITLNLADDGGSLTGTWESQAGSTDVTNAKFDDGTLSFDVTVSTPGGEFELKFEGKLDGDSLEGSMNTARGSFPATATRSQ